MRPTGKYVALDLYQAGGVPILVNRLIDGEYMTGDTPTVTGQTLSQACADAEETAGQDVGARSGQRHQGQRRPGDPQGQSGARWRGGQAQGHTRPLNRSGACI